MSKTESILKISSMIVGGTGLLLSGYSIVADGSMKGESETKDDLGDQYVNMYVKNMSSSRESVLLEKIKKYVILKRLDNPLKTFVAAAKNYTISYVRETMENIPPIALSLGALITPLLFKKHETGINKKIEGINNVLKKIPLISHLPEVPKALRMGTYISAVSAGLLLLGTGKLFLHDIWGVTKDDRI